MNAVAGERFCALHALLPTSARSFTKHSRSTKRGQQLMSFSTSQVSITQMATAWKFDAALRFSTIACAMANGAG